VGVDLVATVEGDIDVQPAAQHVARVGIRGALALRHAVSVPTRRRRYNDAEHLLRPGGIPVMQQGRYDAIIIGAGHNGLVTACYLARAGKKVLVLERRDKVGGACVTEEVWPGFKVSTAAYVNSLFRKEIVRDLRLHDHGFEVLERSPSSFSPFPDGRSLLLGPDAALTRSEIAMFSARDAEAYPQYE